MSTGGYTLGQAAKHTGLSKAALSRAIRDKRLKAVKRDDGSYEIAVHDLGAFMGERRQGENTQQAAQPSAKQEVNPSVTPPETGQLTALQAENEGLRRHVALLEDERNDLRTRLDREGEERRALTRQLVDAREKEPPREEPKPKAGWFDRLLGRG